MSCVIMKLKNEWDKLENSSTCLRKNGYWLHVAYVYENNRANNAMLQSERERRARKKWMIE